MASPIASPATAMKIAASARVVAVLGARTDATSKQKPAFFVPQYLVDDGVEVIPIPIRPEPGSFPGGAKPVSGLAALKERCAGSSNSGAGGASGGGVDVLCCFRRPEDLPSAQEILDAGPPRCLWLQSGIRNEELERAVAGAGAGVVVVADRCMKLDRAAAKASKM